MFRITLVMVDETIVYLSEFPPKFSENFVCIAPAGDNTDRFFNVSRINKIIVDKER